MTDSLLPHPTSALLHNLLVFGRLLRHIGICTTADQMASLATTLNLIPVTDREDFRSAARAVLVNRREDVPLFDRAFELFWRAWMESEGPVEIRRADLRSLGLVETGNGDAEGTADENEGNQPDSSDPLLYSARESLRGKDFSLYTEEELEAARTLMRAMRWEPRRRSLRTRPTYRGRQLDFRRSLRHSVRHGGEILRIERRGPKLKRRNLVLICDISGSMDRYTRLLLHFLHAVESNFQTAEVFVFGTRLTRITAALRHRDPNAAIAVASEEVQDWSGGTRIGASLRTFNRRWARRVLGRGAIVMIISDGWDRGDPVLLAREMERLQRSSYRLIWLNPLLGATGYEPLTQGMSAALPYVDDFLPVHNLDSLQALVGVLSSIQETRAQRGSAI
ncbi:MAG TPA: VWA domain-containing protein [Chloroflexota bacterium]|nr:VWA domain-containing protein [Chloroflexota bacterium]